MPNCVLLTWTAHAPPVWVHEFGRKSVLPSSLRAYSASRCRLPSLPERVGLVGSSQPARWEARKAGSPGPGGAVAPTPASLSLRDSPPAASTKTTFMISSRGENAKHMTPFWLVNIKFWLAFTKMSQNQLFIPEGCFFRHFKWIAVLWGRSYAKPSLWPIFDYIICQWKLAVS